MHRKTVLLLFGGESAEHEVSVSSARNIYAAIDDNIFDVELGFVDKNGELWLLENFDTEVSTRGALQLMPALGKSCFITVPNQKIVKPDILFSVLHGTNGEDGSMQGLAQLLRIPMIGCGVTASAVCMDKVKTKEVLGAHHMKTVPYHVYHRYESVPEFHKLSMTLGSPLFVKPAKSGSSVGVSKVYSEDEFLPALEKALTYSETVLIEQSVTARELEVAVLGTPPAHHVSSVGEIIVGAEFYSYEEKYKSGSTTLQIPADIDTALTARLQAQAGRVYEILGCDGLARVDFFLTDDDIVYVNEVNTLPGFTNTSMFPKLWQHYGLSYGELVETLITDRLQGATMETQSIEE